MKYAIAAVSILSLAMVANATIVYQANFESYDTSAGAVDITINTTGDDDTISGIYTGDGITPVLQAEAAAGDFQTGNYMRMGKGSATGNLGIEQTYMGAFGNEVGEDDVLIISMDYQETVSNCSLRLMGNAVVDGNTDPDYVGKWFGKKADPTYIRNTQRVTLVCNWSSTPITLPTLDTDGNNVVLNTGEYAAYGKYLSSGSYVKWDAKDAGLVQPDKASLADPDYGSAEDPNYSLTDPYMTVNGIRMDGNNNFGSAWDNIIVSNDASELIGGVSILALPVGTIPEPATMVLLGLGGIGVLVRRRR